MTVSRFLLPVLAVLAAPFFLTAQTPTNIVLERPVVVSSQAGPSVPGWAAVDGTSSADSRRWMSATTPLPDWIEISLEGFHKVSQFKFWTGGAGQYFRPMTGFQLQSWNGDQWQVLHSETNYANSGIVDISFPEQLASDRIRMFFTAGEDNQVRLFELEVYGVPYAMQVAGREPAVSGSTYRPGNPITVQFNAGIVAVNTNLIQVRTLPEKTPVGVSSVSVSGNELSIQAALQYNQDYEVVIPEGALALASNPSLPNPPVFWSFTSLPQAPQVAEYSNTIGATDAVEVTFDRPVQLVDSNLVQLISLESGSGIAVQSVSVVGEVLTVTHGGVAADQRLMLRLQPGAVLSPDSATVNSAINLGVFSGVYEVLAQRNFKNGLQGFIPAHTLGIVPLTARVWDLLAGSTPDWASLDPGPSEDFSWVGRDRGPSADFIATPALNLIADEEYTLSFQYQGTMRLDLREVLSLDRTLTPLDTISGSGTRNVTFTAAQSGPQHVLFAFNGSSPYSWCMLDNVSVVRTVRPAIYLESPTTDFVMAEGNPLIISGKAFNFSADLDNVKVYLDDRLVGTFSSQHFELSVSDYDPGVQDVRIVARDTRGEEVELVRPITITFTDGTLEPFIQYAFRTGTDGVQSSASWISSNTGYLNFFVSNGLLWMSTPRIFLQAGESYVVQFLANKAETNNKTMFLSLENQPGYPANPVALASFEINSTEWVLYQTVINVEVNGGYHLTLYNVGSTSYTRLQIDNFRVVGMLNSAPAIALTRPTAGTRTLAGAPIQLIANASDVDGQVTRVEFWNGSFLIGTVYQPPYSLIWESAPVGGLTVSAIAYDNAGAVSNPATVQIESLENRVNISTNMGTDSVFEYIRGMAYQEDGTLVIGGVINPEFFTGVTPQVLSSASAGDNGVIVRMSEDGRTVLSVSVVGEAVVDLSLDVDGNIYAAVGTTGIIKLNPTADTLLWHYSPSDMGIPTKRAHRIDTAPNGMTAALMSPLASYGEQTVSAGDVAVVHPNGALHPVLMAGSGATYTTDIAVDAELERVWITGWKNFYTVGEPSGGSTFPVDVPIFLVRSYASGNFNQRVIQGYDWESNNDNGRWLNQLDNNMADTRTQRVTIAPNGDVYIGLEYDGGNTPIRYDPYDLSKAVQLVGGDNYHNNAFTSTVPKVAVIRLDRVTGAFKTGQYMTNRLSSGADNTFRLKGGEILVDNVGRVHVVGDAASGTPLTFDALPGVYNGGAVHWVLSPDLSTREMVTRWASSGSLNAIAVSPKGKVAVGGNLTGDTMYRRRAMLDERQSSSDALLVVGDFSGYYSFQPGDHPRLYFTEQDIPELRFRATQAPFDEMVQRMIESLDDDGGYRPINLDHSYSRSLRAKTSAFLYVVTGDENYALMAREDVEWVISSTHIPWADTGTKGLESFWMAAHIALAYDWCAMSPNWDDAFLFQVSKALLDIGKVIINHGGTEQNTAASSNWQGARGSSGGLALLATDSRFDAAMLDAAYNRVRTYINSSVGSHPDTRGWADEGLGYTYYPYGLFVGPFAEAMARMEGRDLRTETAIGDVYRSVLASPTAAVNVYDYGGIKPDWANDNMHIRGEGVFGQSFYFVDPSLLPAARWVFDRLMGPLARDRARWDDTRGGAVWSFLHYPIDVIPQSPLEFYGWHTANVDQHGIGITSFRNQFENETDILAQFKVRLFASGGHDGPDGLGIRIIGNDTAWVVGGGRDAPGKNIGQSSLYKVEPGAQLSGGTNLNTGTLVGTPLVKVDGGGHIIGQMATNNLGVINHKRWFVTDFDTTTTGAQATFLVADTSNDGAFWQLPTSPFNTITTSGNTFTITSPNGATLQGTVLHPASVTLNHGTRSRGGDFAPLNGGPQSSIDPILNPQVPENKFVTVQGTGGSFLIAFTIQPAGETHPTVTRTSGTVADAVVQIGSRTYGITTNNILYNGQLYTPPDAQIVFDAGDGVVLQGSTNQFIAYGGAPVAPMVEAPAGYVFLGWSHAFDAITRDMTIQAIYAPLESTPTAPSFLRGSVDSFGIAHLLWNDNSLGETGFRVEVSADAGQNWIFATSTAENVTQASISGLNPLSAYAFRVRAEGVDSPSGWSNVFSITTPAENLPPIFTSTAPTLAHEGTQFNYFIQAEDAEEDSLTLSLVSAPEWLTLYNSGGGAAVLTGIPLADTTSVSITVAVTDGVNAPVEQSFTVSINPAPVITLVWPQSTPVSLQPKHGIYVEAEVADDSPFSTTWAIVQGPADTWIGDANALATDIYFDRAGTYTVRLTSTDAEGARSQMEFQVMVDRLPAGSVAEVLAFEASNDYVTVDSNFRDTSSVLVTNLDLDGSGLNQGSRRYFAFSHQDANGVWQNPLSPTAAASKHGGRFFGGIVADRVDHPNRIDALWRIVSTDAIRTNFSNNHNASIHAAIFWVLDDFKNVAADENVFLTANAQFSITFGTGFRDNSDLRWLVRANDKFYVSQTTILNTVARRTFSGGLLHQELWAEYNPQGPHNLNFDQSPGNFTVPTTELGPIQAVGYIIDADGYLNRRIQVDVQQFRLTGEVLAAIAASPVIALDAPTSVPAGTATDLLALVDYNDAEDGSSEWSVTYGPGTVTFGDANAADTTVSASLPGEYKLRFSAWAEGQASFREVVWIVEPSDVTPSTPLEDWLETNFGALAGGTAHLDAALTADPDKDGVPNLLEFALLGHPFQANSASMPQMDHVSHGSNLHLRLTVDKNPAATDLIYIVEVSADLQTWSSLEGTDVHTMLNTTSSLVVEDTIPVSVGSPRFIRLRVELIE